MEWLQNLISGLRGAGPRDMLPRENPGMAPQAADALMLRKAYMQYAAQMQEVGQQPLPPDQWMKQMMLRQGGYGTAQ